ncbi:MAG: NAD(P)H-dependent oxidoreductase [Bacteroidota bacterium]
MFNCKIIVASTRPGRKGGAVAAWIAEKARAYTGFTVELLDLAEINLPFLDEPEHPKQKKYQHDHTKKWSAAIESADAFIMVTPEYNYGMPATLKNAIDFLFWEWSKKPVGFVSYGGMSGGMKSVQMLKQVVTTLNMMPLTESIAIPYFTKYINQEAVFTADELLDKNADTLLKALEAWAGALKTLR